LIQKEIHMFKQLKRFVREEDGQDFAEYALILGAIGVVAIAVIALPQRIAGRLRSRDPGLAGRARRIDASRE
jgi:Flp pilus assembly pilin Flp